MNTPLFRHLTLVVATLLWLLPTSPAQALDLDAGYSYLEGQVNPDGSFGSMPLRDTGVVLGALGEAGRLEPYADQALTFYTYEETLSLDLAARSASGLSNLVVLTNEDLAFISSSRRSDGSWGSFPGWPGGIMETTQVLDLYTYAGSPDFSAIGASLTWLVGKQKSDGSFAWEDNTTSDALLTAEVLHTLVGWSDTFALDSYINKAVTYLYTQQQSSGLIGTVLPELTTALTLRATNTWAGVDSAKWKKAFNGLSAVQKSDGSWANDTYTTALSLSALAGVRPDLSVTAVAAVESPLLEGAAAHVTVSLKNEGRIDLADGADIHLTFIPADSGVEVPVGIKTLGVLAAGASTTLTFDWSLVGIEGSGYLKAVADPNNTLGEKDRADNTRLQSVSVLGGSDVVVYAQDAVVQPGKAAPEDTLTYSSLVVSQSAVAHSSVKVTLHDGNPSSGGKLLTTVTLSLGVGESKEVSWSGKLASGTHNLYLTADSDNTITEKNETNNQSITTVEVAPRIDLQVGVGKVKVAPSQVTTGSDVSLSVTVYNGGRSPSGAFTVGAYLYDPATMSGPSQRVLKGTAAVTSLAAGEATTATIVVSTSNLLGNITLYGVADSAGVIAELAEDNNESSATVNIVKAPNLAIQSGDFQPQNPIRESARIYLSSAVRNTGGSDLYNVAVRFYLDSVTGTTLGTTTIQTLPAGQTVTTPLVYWNTTGTTPGNRTLVVKVDPDAALSESDENDNTQSAVVTIEPRPDLAFKTGLSVNPTQPDQGQAATLSATIENTSTTAITAPFTVKFFDGTTSTGALIATVTVPSLGGNTNTVVSTPWATEGKAGRHTFTAQVDAGAAVDESNESNNTSTTTANVTSGDASLVPPTNFTSTLSGDNVNLSWTASANPAGYRVYRDGITVNPPDTATNLVTSSTPVVASTTQSGSSASSAIDGNNATYWLGDGSVNSWTYDLDFGKEVEISSFKVVFYAQANFNINLSFQSYVAPYYFTHQSGALTSTSTGPFSGTFTLPRTLKTQKVRLYMSRSSSSFNPAAISEIVINPPALVTTTSYTDINVDAATHAYEVRAADGGGREGEPATQSVAVGDIDPPTNVYAVAYSDKTQVNYTKATSTNVKGYELVRDNLPLVFQASITGMSAVASSSNSSYPPANALDGSTSTFWQSGSGTTWTYDLTLPAGKRIYALNLYFKSGQYAVDYDIMGWTGTEWIVEDRVRSNNYSTRGHLFSQFGLTDKVRISFIKGFTSTVALNEVQLVAATPITGSAIQDTYRPDYAIYYRVGAMSDKHVAFAATEPFVPPKGEEAPLPPTGLTVSSYTRSDITLSWTAISSSTLAGYNVYDTQTGEKLNSALLTSPTFTVPGVIEATDTSYGYGVTGVNTFGYESTTKTNYTWTPPTPATPTLSQVTTGTTVALSWTNPSEPLRDGWYVFKNSVLYATVNSATFSDVDVAAATHTYQVQGFDLFGRTGGKSNSVSSQVVRTDLAITPTDIVITPNPGTALDTASLTATVFNLGDKASAQTTLRFYDGDPAAGGTQISSVTLAAINGGGLKTVSSTWSLAGKEGIHQIYAVADPTNTVKEWSETNNSASTTLTVYAAPAYDISMGSFKVDTFPTVSVPVTVKDNFGRPVTGLGTRYLTLKEDGASLTGFTFVEGGSEGTYTLSWTSPTLSRNGSSRAVSLTITVSPATGTTTSSYLAPSDPIRDVAVNLVTVNPTSPSDKDNATFTATVANLGSETETNIPVRLYRSSTSGEVLGNSTITSLAAGKTTTVTFSASVRSGTVPYLVVADPDGAVVEKDEANNIGTLSLFVPDPVAPDLSITGVVLSPASPQTGDQVIITATVLNSGAPTSSVQVQAYLGDPASGGKAIGSSATLTSLAKDTTADVSFAWDTTSLTGTQNLLVIVDPFSRIGETNETNNRHTSTATVAASRTQLTLALSKSSAGPGEDLTISGTVTPTSTFTGTVELTLTDTSGIGVADLGILDFTSISSPTAWSRPFNTGTYLAGSYTVVATLKEGELLRVVSSAPLTVTAKAELTAALGSVGASYNAYDSVVASGTLTNSSINVVLTDVTATLALLSPGGVSVASTVVSAPTLDRGQNLKLDLDFALEDAAPGTYTLKLSGSSGTTTTSTTRTLVVTSSADTGAGVVGTLVTDKEQAAPGEVVLASWSVENRGNVDLSAVPARVAVLAEDGTEAFTEEFNLTVARGGSKVGEVDFVADFAADTYSVLLELKLQGVWVSFARASLTLLEFSGTLVADPSQVEGGVDGVSLRWSLTNAGTDTLEDLPISLRHRPGDGCVLLGGNSDEPTALCSSQVSVPGGTSVDDVCEVDDTLLCLGMNLAELVLEVEGADAVVLASAEFQVGDSLPPTTRLDFVGTSATDGDDWYVEGTTQLTLTATDTFSGVEEVSYRLDGGTATPYTAPLSMGKEGSHTLAFAAADVAGNQEVSQSVVVVQDDSNPVVSITGVEDRSCQAGGVILTIEVGDLSPLTVVQTMDGKAFAGGEVAAVGRHQVEVIATDILGHQTLETVTFDIVGDACQCDPDSGCATPPLDGDGDGYTLDEGDCDDTDPASYPGATEICDGQDNNCDDAMDEGLDCPEITDAPDSDGDGYVDGADCDPQDGDINPGVPEVCDNGVDDNCNGVKDEDTCEGEGSPTEEPTEGEGTPRPETESPEPQETATPEVDTTVPESPTEGGSTEAPTDSFPTEAPTAVSTPPVDNDDRGCGCDTSSEASIPAGLLLTLAAMVLRRRQPGRDLRG